MPDEREVARVNRADEKLGSVVSEGDTGELAEV